MIYLFSKTQDSEKNKPKIIKGSGVCTNEFIEGNEKKVYDLIFHSRVIEIGSLQRTCIENS